MRKIIQITSNGVANTSQTQCNAYLHALCDDGSVWVIYDNDNEWHEIPGIPQTQEQPCQK